MVTTIGIVGPSDLVTSTSRICANLPGVEVVPLKYRRETDTPKVLADAPASIDAWLFTGVVPYQIAASHDLLDRPAAHVEYTGATLLRALVQLLREGRDVTSMSIDVLDEAQVRETLEEVGLPTRGVRVLPYRPGLDSEDVVAFHREARDEGATVAVTCLRSAYEKLRVEQTTIRLAPSVHSVRSAVNGLLLTHGALRSDDAQIALGLVEIAAKGEDALKREVGSLGGSVVRYDDKRFLIVTTRGPLEQATASFTELGMLTHLKERFGPVRIGFGIGGSGAEAEALARRALGRARTAGRTAAVVSLRNDIDITLVGGAAPRPLQRAQLQLLAQRAGLSKATLEKLQELVRATPGGGLTTRTLAEHLGVQPRTARRVLNRLERAGVADATGTQIGTGSGRPLVVYRVHL
ncbi:regulatory GntR family protein [Kribbella amoyensis]|uniref:Regulatory GntR family protein n=1 Tax=Kribbella amoyensis TaxID=996641 RepID=A0A561B2Z9_9ACTN|nr:HTH domain-containing protein [Kribbella amoyensis]TWD73214.1 regulatory GntR family protein [Kribbella amoyensis]